MGQLAAGMFTKGLAYKKLGMRRLVYGSGNQ